MIGGMTTRSVTAVAAALLLPGLAAVAQTPGAPASSPTMAFDCPAPGTTFVYDSGTRVRATGRDGFDCLMETVGGKPYRLRALLFDNPAPDGANMTAYIDALKPERLWPLEVGRKIEARYSAGGHTWTYVLTVARHERRTGPREAMIDTFLVEMNEQGEKGERSVSRWWISPADRFAIRFDFSDGTGKANRAVVTEVTR